MSDNNSIIELLLKLDDLIEKEIQSLEIPMEHIEIKNRMLEGRSDEFDFDINISMNEFPAHLNLWMNNSYRQRELQRAMGLLLIYSKTGSINNWQCLNENERSRPDYSEHFWASYGDFQIRSCSLLDSVGAYLAFAFFGIIDAPFYFNQVIDSISLKYSNTSERMILDGDPYRLKDQDGWKILLKSKKRYSETRRWRDEILHVFSPMMYTTVENDLEQKRILRSPSLNSEKALEECKETFYLLSNVTIAADQIVSSFVNTDSYHRNYYY